MRNSILPFLAIVLIAGCQTQNNQDPLRQQLHDAKVALQQQQYDQAIQVSDQILAAHPDGVGAPEALYFRGRAYQDRPKANVSEETSDYLAARKAYVTALQMPVETPLEGRLRAGIALVAYFQDDFETSRSQWVAAYDKLDNLDDKALVWYRYGQANQRLGRWTEADEAFAAVQQMVPGCPVAASAAALSGCRAFYVQIGKAANDRDAQGVIAQLRRLGYVAAVRQGVISIGPIPDYPHAKAARNAVAAQFPQASVFP